MKTIEEINDSIDMAYVKMSEIEKIREGNLEGNIFSVQQELRNMLENIRLDIEALLNRTYVKSYVHMCRYLLEDILEISEKLRFTYISPDYSESFYIYDVLKSVQVKCC